MKQAEKATVSETIRSYKEGSAESQKDSDFRVNIKRELKLTSEGLHEA